MIDGSWGCCPIPQVQVWGSGGDSQVVGVELGAGAGEDGLWAIYLFSGFLL